MHLWLGEGKKVNRDACHQQILGIIIAMYWDDHSPAHFHAKHGGYEITTS
jgi:hypothetical protein